MSLKRYRTVVCRRESRSARAAALGLEFLESRVLFNGLTVVVHGAQQFGGIGSDNRPGWVDRMGQQIATRYGGNTAVYLLRVESNGDNPKVTSFTRVSGAVNSAASTSGETVILVDWAKASNVDVFGLSADYSGTKIANSILPYITTAFPAAGITAPLGEGAIQLIGHSRGGSVISELAKGLGAVGMWVDQVTFLDPRPVPPDPLISLKSNVIFSDDYFQTSGDGIIVPNGIKVTGAHNVGPLKVEGSGLDSTHNNIVLFYQGTIDLADQSVPGNWYSGNALNRGSIGFYFAHGGGGSWARPADGLASLFGGTASRASLSHTAGAAQWANVANLNLSTYTFGSGQTLTASFRYGSFNANSTLQWFLDPDRNPNNNNSIAVGKPSTLGVTGDAAVLMGLNLAPSAAKGTYYLEARVSNAAGARYAYSAAVSVVSNAPTVALDVPGPSVLQGWAIDTDTPAAAVAMRLDVDGVTVATTTANLPRPDLVATFGSANHGYTFDLSGLSDGVHKIQIYSVDSTSGATALALSRTISTQNAPVGSVDWFDGSVLAGWAVDPDVSSSSIQVRYTIDNNVPVIISADQTRTDLTALFGSSNHGYSLVLPQLTAGSHTIAVEAIDTISKALFLLGKRTVTVANPQGDVLPKGSIDAASTTGVAGWAQDPSNPTASINVRIDVDGVAGTPIAASLIRGDLQGPLGSTNHGYSVPLSLTPEQHKVEVFAIDPATSAFVFLGSRRVGSTAPAGSLDIVSNMQIVGWAASKAIAAGPSAAAAIRIDIDGIAGAVFGTSSTRADINALYGQGTWGYSIGAPLLTAGSHSVTLVYVDRQTLTATVLMTRALVI